MSNEHHAIVANPLGEHRPPAIATVEASARREIAEVQSAVVMARTYPRDRIGAVDAILQDCTRLSLAQAALYSYSRGGQEISGPSIRLAEAMAQSWGNLTYGIREKERRIGESTMEAFCWDLQTNVRPVREFQVKHERYSRDRGRQALTGDIERDINELTSNQGARRLRACILEVIPGDVVEAAVEQCEATLLAKADTSPEAVGKLVKAFEQFGVTREMVETRIQRRIDTIRPAQIVQLRKVWSSLNDGMSVATDWFQKPKPAEDQPAVEAKGSEGLKQRLRTTSDKKAEPPPGLGPVEDGDLLSSPATTEEREPGEEG